MNNGGPRHFRSWLFSPAMHTEYRAKATEVRAGTLLDHLSYSGWASEQPPLS
jgi:hypothetical protein